MRKYQSLIEKMTLEEKALMMSGQDTWSTVPFEKYGIPSMVLSDGPHGIRRQAGAADHLGLNASLPSTCFPTAATIANSWDEALGEELGTFLGEEAKALGVNVVLGPGLNIKRSPLCGRNFEYFSEDPYLSGKMAAAYIRGMQSHGIAACPKHFAANSQELRRMSNNSVVDERTFRELYTTGFEIAVKEGKAKSIMSSYNQINGVYANESSHLLQEILVDEWNFDGFVVSDWGGSNDHVEGVRNGSHLEMPSTGQMGAQEIIEAVESKRLDESILDDRLDELLHIIFTTQIQERKDGWDEKKHHQFARKAARESIVLLKNEEEILPLKQRAKVALIGDFVETPRYQGAGSSLVNPTMVDDTLKMMVQCGLQLSSYAKGYERNKPTSKKLLEEARIAAESGDYVLVYAGLDEISESEGMDRTHMRMAQNQIDVIEAVAEVNENVIVVLSAGSVIEMPWLSKVKAVVHGYLGGQAGAGALLDVITGKYCPSGKLNETYPLHYEDSPSFGYYPGKEWNSEYRESLYVGYRYFETVEKEVQFPFGFGLSYTTFEYSALNVTENGVSFQIKNTGSVDGAEIAQLYVGIKSNAVFRPVRELKGFQKVFLKAGEEKEVSIAFDDKTFRYYNTVTNSWEIEAGVYEIAIGKNAHEMLLTAACKQEGTNAPFPDSNKEMSSYFSGEVTSISDEEFETLLGRPIPDGSWSGEIGVNDAICQLYYAKSGLARFAYKILTGIKNRSEKKGKPNLNVLFIYNMPFRGISKMTGGAINMKMAEALVEMVNGKEWSGLKHFIGAARKKKKK